MMMVSQLDEQIDMEEKLMPRPRRKLVVLICKRCKHKWVPRMKSPIVCPACHSPYWNKPASSGKRSKRKYR